MGLEYPGSPTCHHLLVWLVSEFHQYFTKGWKTSSKRKWSSAIFKMVANSPPRLPRSFLYIFERNFSLQKKLFDPSRTWESFVVLQLSWLVFFSSVKKQWSWHETPGRWRPTEPGEPKPAMKNSGSGNLKISAACHFFPVFLLLSYYSVGFGALQQSSGQLVSATIMVGKKNHGVMNHETKGTPQLQPGK